MSNLVDVCHCSHDRTTHHECGGVCLGVRCDCQKFTHRDDPLPKGQPVRPANHPIWCKCYACKLAPWFSTMSVDAYDEGPPTHPIACTCPFCMPQAHTASCKCSWCDKP